MANNPDHTSRTHSKRSPSAAERWIGCPGSPHACDGIKSKSSVYAAAGALEHMIAERAISEKYSLGISTLIGKKFPVEEYEITFTADACDSVQVYLDYVQSRITPTSICEVEQELDLTHVHPVVKSGTVDFEIVHPETATLEIIDYKGGAGYAVDLILPGGRINPQLGLYASAALHRHHNHAIERVILTIVQPKAKHRDGQIRSVTLDVWDFPRMEAEWRDAAEKTIPDDAPRISGAWCKWCPANGDCEAYRNRALKIAQDDFGEMPEPINMTTSHMTRVLENAEFLESYVAAVKAYATSMLADGHPIAGWKLVDKRAVRQWRDEDEAANYLMIDQGLHSEDVYSRKIITPAQAEKKLGKNKSTKELLAPFVVAESSGVTLVRDSDPRPGVGSTNDFDTSD